MTTTKREFVPINERSGIVPAVIYKLTFKGETMRCVRTMREALEWLSHAYRQTPDYACYSWIDGEEIEVTRNPRRKALA